MDWYESPDLPGEIYDEEPALPTPKPFTSIFDITFEDTKDYPYLDNESLCHAPHSWETRPYFLLYEGTVGNDSQNYRVWLSDDERLIHVQQWMDGDWRPVTTYKA